MAKLKYLIIRASRTNREYAVVFPANLVHQAVASLHLTHGQKVVSAGFCIFGDKVEAFGGSDTLELESRPIDAEIIRRDFTKPEALGHTMSDLAQ